MREISQNRESSKRKKYPSEACLNSVLNIIEEIKVPFLVAVLKFHSCIDDIPMGSNMLDHLIKISEIGECFMDGNNDMPLLIYLMKYVISILK